MWVMGGLTFDVQALTTALLFHVKRRFSCFT
jgi:hypothetical protein